MFTIRLPLLALLFCISLSNVCVFAGEEEHTSLTAIQKELLKNKVRAVYEGTDANVRQGISVASYGGTFGKWAFVCEYSNRSKFELLDTSMVFETGSITELFTAAAIMKLSEQGKLRLDEAVSKFLPQYPGVPKQITIEQLLLHKSGLRDYMNDIYLIQNAWERFPITVHSPTKIPATLGDPVYEPGKQIMYSRTNYLMLALIVEVASGTTYADYLRNVFFKPLDLRKTFVGYYETDSSRYMSGIVDTTFETWGGDMKDIPNTARYTIQFGIGNIVSTPSEIAKWGYMLLSGRVLQKKSLDKILSFAKDLKNRFIGAGIRKIIVNERALYGVVSSLYGYESFLLYDSVNNISFCGVLNETHNNILFKSSLSTLYENIFDIFKPQKAGPYNLKFHKVSLYIDNNKLLIGAGDNVNGNLEFSDISDNNSSVKATIKVFCNDPDIKLKQSTFSDKIYGRGRFHWFNILRFEVDKNAKLNRQVVFNVVVLPETGTVIKDTFIVKVPLAGYGRSAYFTNDSTAAILRTIQTTKQLSSAFTLEACIKPSSEMRRDHYYSIAYYGYKIRCFVFNRSINLTIWHNNSYSSLTTSDSILHYDIWQHIAVQWDGVSKPLIFLNGKSVETTSSYSTLYTGLFNDKMKVFVIGNTPSFNNSPQPFCGYIDNVRLWGKVRTEKQIQINMKLINPTDRDLLLIDGTFDKLIAVQEGVSAEFDGLFEQCDYGEQYNSATVSIDETQAEEEQFRLYSRDGILNIKSGSQFKGMVKIFNIVGEEIFSDNIDMTSGDYSAQLQNINSNRMYIVQLQGNGYNKMFKVYNQ